MKIKLLTTTRLLEDDSSYDIHLEFGITHDDDRTEVKRFRFAADALYYMIQEAVQNESPYTNVDGMDRPELFRRVTEKWNEDPGHRK